MTRRYATMSPVTIRDQCQVGLDYANKLHRTSKLLDRVERANSVEELRFLLAQFITMQTGVE